MVEYLKNMNKGLTVPKWVLTVWPKIPQMPQNYLPNLSAQSQKFWISAFAKNKQKISQKSVFLVI